MFRDLPAALGRHAGGHHQGPADHPAPHPHIEVGGARRTGGGARCGPGGGRGTRARPRRCPSRIRETVEREMPDSLPRALYRVARPCAWRPPRLRAEQITAHRGPAPPASGGGAGRGRRIRCAARGSRARLPRRWWPRSWASCRCACWCAAGCATRRPAPITAAAPNPDRARAARPGGRRRKTPVQRDRGRPGLPGSAWTRPTGDRASWVHSSVNPGRGTWAPTMPPPVPTTPGGSPAGIATTLRDAPPGASGVRAPVDAADPADANPAGPAAGAGVHPARGRSVPLGLPPPSSPRRRG